MTTLFLTPRIVVTVNGIGRRTLTGSTVCGFRSSFSTASIQFAYGEEPAVPGDKVEVELGYVERGIAIVFTGEADDDTLEYWPNANGVQATGYLARMQRALGVENLSATPDPVSGIHPAFEASSATDTSIATFLAFAYGIPVGDIQGVTPEQLFGVIKPVQLGKDQPGWGLLQELDRLTFMVSFNAPDGTLRRLPINGIPSGAALTLTEGVSLKKGSRSRSRRSVINKVTMTGLQDAGGPGLTPTATRQAPSIYIPTPPQYQPEAWQSALAETEEACDTYAALRLGQMNRLTQSVTVDLDRCRPDIYPAMSLAISAPHFKSDSGTIYWVEQVEHNWNAQGINTRLGLIAATASEGLNPNQAPIALIKYRIEKEHLGDGTNVWIVFADGITSYDPDGVAIDLDPHHGIGTYLWSGTPSGPSTPAALPQATFVYTADPTGATITLVVRDTSLKSGTATITLTADIVTKAGRRDLWGAAGADLFFTVDGGVSWFPTGVPAKAISEQAHPEYQIAAAADGTVKKVVIDGLGGFTVTPVTSPTNATAVHINLGIDGKGTHRVWLGCNGGETYLSTDDGATFIARGTIPNITGSTGPAIRHIEESPYSFGTLYAISGPAMWLSFDEGVTWAIARQYPDVALTATAFASGRFADVTADKSYHWATFKGTSANAQQRVLEQLDLIELDWPVASKPAQPSGLTIGAVAPNLYAVDQVGTGRSWYIEDFTGGGEFVEKTYSAGFGLPQHIIRDPDFDGIVYGAAAGVFFKTFDKFTTVRALMTFAGGLFGWMIGYGKLRAPLPVKGNLVWIGSPSGVSTVRWVYRFTDTGFTRVAHPLSGVGAATLNIELYATTNGSLLTVGATLDVARNAALATAAHRSTDGGITWTAIGSLVNAYAMAVGPDGYCYAACQNDLADGYAGYTLWRSTDDGATWIQVHSLGVSATIPLKYNAIAVDPSNALRVVSKSFNWPGSGATTSFVLSVDGGVTWTVLHIGPDEQAGLARGPWIGITANGVYEVNFGQQATPTALHRAALTVGASVVDVTTPRNAADPVPSLAVDGTTYLYGSVGVIQSLDNGASWTDTLAFATDLGSVGASGFVPGDAANDWYALGHATTKALVRRLATADPAAPWVSLTATLLAAFPDGAYYCHARGAVRL